MGEKKKNMPLDPLVENLLILVDEIESELNNDAKISSKKKNSSVHPWTHNTEMVPKKQWK